MRSWRQRSERASRARYPCASADLITSSSERRWHPASVPPVDTLFGTIPTDTTPIYPHIGEGFVPAARGAGRSSAKREDGGAPPPASPGGGRGGAKPPPCDRVKRRSRQRKRCRHAPTSAVAAEHRHCVPRHGIRRGNHICEWVPLGWTDLQARMSNLSSSFHTGCVSGTDKGHGTGDYFRPVWRDAPGLAAQLRRPRH